MCLPACRAVEAEDALAGYGNGQEQPSLYPVPADASPRAAGSLHTASLIKDSENGYISVIANPPA